MYLRCEFADLEIIGAGEGNWTLDLNVGNVSLYHWATPASYFFLTNAQTLSRVINAFVPKNILARIWEQIKNLLRQLRPYWVKGLAQPLTKKRKRFFRPWTHSASNDSIKLEWLSLRLRRVFVRGTTLNFLIDVQEKTRTASGFGVLC